MKPVDLSIDDYHKTVESFHNESDRAAAVLAGSFVENFIAKFLRFHMVDDKEVDSLFDGFGPFSTANQRVQAAYAFGLISEKDKKDFNCITKIRNRFAHHPLEASFDSRPISEWCKNLSTFSLYPILDQPENVGADNRHRFIVAVSLLVSGWYKAMNSKREPNA